MIPCYKTYAVFVYLLTFIPAPGVCNETELSQENRPQLLLISTLDGSLIGVEQSTGIVRWRIKEEPAVKVPVDLEKAVVPLLLPDPKDGSLYQLGTSDREALKKLAYTIPELVTSSPCRSSDGVLYSGKKLDRWFSINPKNGEKKLLFGFEGYQTTCPMEGPDAVFISRTEYNIMMYDTVRKEKSWNVTYFDYSSYTMDAKMMEGYGKFVFSIIVLFLLLFMSLNVSYVLLQACSTWLEVLQAEY